MRIAILNMQIYNRSTKMSEPDKSKDYYSVLGAAEDATQSEIDRHYRRKAVQHHPDRGGSEEDMKTLNEAYRVLKDKAVRDLYDSERQKPAHRPPSRPDSETTLHTARPLQVEAITHQVLVATVFIILGLVLLFIVRFQYVLFLWPLALLAVFMVLVGIVQAHTVMTSVRRQYRLVFPALRFVAVLEVVFWSFVFGGGYGVYLLLNSD